MRFHTRLGSLAVAASLAFAAGCSGGSSSAPAGYVPTSHTGSVPMSVHHSVNYQLTAPGFHYSSVRVTTPVHPVACGAALEFISDFQNNVVNIYSGKTLCHQITGLVNPQGLTIDSKKNLWVANTGASNVLEYKAPYTGAAIKTLNDAGYYPTDIALCKGYEAVTNIFATNGSAGNVEIYKGTSTNPTSTLTDSNTTSERFDSCDPAGNLFTDYTTSSGTGGTNEWLLGKGKPKELTAFATSFPGGVRYEGGSLWVDDQTNHDILMGKAPYTKVSKTITLSGASDPVSFSVSAKDTQILTADAGLNAGEFYTLTGKNTGSLAGNSGGVPIGAEYNTDDSP